MPQWTVSDLTSVDLLEAKARAGNDYIFDLMIVACAFESRSLKFPQLFATNAARKIALRIPGYLDCEKRKRKLSRFGFNVVTDDTYNVEKVVQEEVEKCLGVKETNFTRIRILLDVSSFPRKMLAAIVASLAKTLGSSGFELTFAYSLAAYDAAPSNQTPPNRKVSPVHPLFAGWTRPNLPVTAVVGLGYERGKALGAVEYLQVADCFLFLPSSPEKKYRTKVDKHNGSLLREASPESIIDYDVLRPVQTLQLLNSVVRGIKAEAKPVILPFGPKIFFAISLLLGLSYPEVAVWHVSGEDSAPLVDHCATSHICAIKCTIQLCNKPVDYLQRLAQKASVE
jgi:hypothetical protein